MNRTERLYALVEELRAIAPLPRTVAWLARRFEVSHRTVQRDLRALMSSGVPVRCEAGRGGGWFADPEMTLPPINLTAAEAVAVAVALVGAENKTPFSASGRDAMRKLASALSSGAANSVRDLTGRIHVLPARTEPDVLHAVELAVTLRLVVRLSYVDASGQETDREVEPAGLLSADGHWYLVGWCRTRLAGRGFRLDRIRVAEVTEEAARDRDLSELDGNLAARVRRAETLRSLVETSEH